MSGILKCYIYICIYYLYIYVYLITQAYMISSALREDIGAARNFDM